MAAPLPDRVPVVIVGAGFAGAATAWALAQRGFGTGAILEQEETYGFHASGRNAAILRLVESDPVIRVLAARSARHIRKLETTPEPLLGIPGGLTLGSEGVRHELEAQFEATRSDEDLRTEMLTAAAARSRFPLLEAVAFDVAVFCPAEAIVDIHALLTRYLHDARKSGFSLHTRCTVREVTVEGGRVTGVETDRGSVRADVVVEAGGAWAGRLERVAGAAGKPLPLQPLRRHLFVTGPPAGGHRRSPFAWLEDAAFYFRPEGDGLLFSPCDETPMAAGDPPTDPAATDLLAEKLSRRAPAFTDLPIRRSWACLRTFAPDRRPIIGPDPDLPGLFHVSGLGGFGMGTSAAVGELAASLIAGERPDWIDVATVSPARFQ
jgi:glycine/D-amino acid oxidase-like deaminating enzyme